MELNWKNIKYVYNLTSEAINTDCVCWCIPNITQDIDTLATVLS